MVVKEKLTPEEEQQIWESYLVIVPMGLISIVSIFHMVYLISIYTPLATIILYMFLLWVPLVTGTIAAMYEIAFSLKIKKSFLFHVKRFLSRIIFSSGYSLTIIIFWNVLSSFMSPLMSDQNILLIAGVILTLILCVFIIIPKTRAFLIKLFAGEW